MSPASCTHCSGLCSACKVEYVELYHCAASCSGCPRSSEPAAPAAYTNHALRPCTTEIHVSPCVYPQTRSILICQNSSNKTNSSPELSSTATVPFAHMPWKSSTDAAERDHVPGLTPFTHVGAGSIRRCVDRTMHAESVNAHRWHTKLQKARQTHVKRPQSVPVHQSPAEAPLKVERHAHTFLIHLDQYYHPSALFSRT
eukprot:SAG11_NODE_464_length_9216_cov_131.568326_9_plen_199_part_00